MVLEKVISGGQTGADQAGLRVARRFGLATGGWMPKDFDTSNGPDPDFAQQYGMREHPGNYADRTDNNVRQGDATLRLAIDFKTKGERCTLNSLLVNGKPYLDIDKNDPRPAEEVAAWLVDKEVRVLNVAGNTEPKNAKGKTAGITQFAEEYLTQVFLALGLTPREEEASPPPAPVAAAEEAAD